MQLPPTLAHQGRNIGSDFVEDWFSNEAVGSPEQMDTSGIFFDVEVSQDTGDLCLQHNLRQATVDSERAITVDGTDATLKLIRFTGGVSGEFPSLLLNLLHDRHCYHFIFLTQSTTLRDASEATALRILGSFRFGAGLRATP